MGTYCEADFMFKNYRIVINFYDLGHRCGYVGMPKDHPAYGIGYEKLYDIKCHGGLTYSDDHAPDKEPDGRWYIGFDCAHSGDCRDTKSIIKYFGPPRWTYPAFEWETLWTQDMVIQECKQIVEQLEKLLNEAMLYDKQIAPNPEFKKLKASVDLIFDPN